MFDGQHRFLDGEPLPLGQKLAFTTFPRSGNSFLRRFLENTTGVLTGSNIPMYLCSNLQQMGMKGEEVLDERCWIIKTH